MERIVDSNARRRVEGKIIDAYAKELSELLRDNIHKAFRSESKTVDLEEFEDDVHTIVYELAEEIAILPSCK